MYRAKCEPVLEKGVSVLDGCVFALLCSCKRSTLGSGVVAAWIYSRACTPHSLPAPTSRAPLSKD